MCLRQLDLRLAFLGPPPTGFRTEVVVGPQHSAHPVLERHVVCSSRGSLQLAGSTFRPGWLLVAASFLNLIACLFGMQIGLPRYPSVPLRFLFASGKCSQLSKQSSK